MSSVAQILGLPTDPHPLKDAFLRWQCRVRMIAMREKEGRPDDSIAPELTLAGQDEPMGSVITIMSKLPQFGKTPEMMHVFKHTNDPAQRRDKALQMFSETYYQKSKEFSDILTAVFPEGSPGAAKIRAAERCSLKFEAYSQTFTLDCKVWTLTKANALFQATWWHNSLFNPAMSDEVVMLGFEPDWDKSTADPSPV